jgi:hypothetical protein
MVLAELGGRITNALRSIGSKTVIDKEAIDAMLKGKQNNKQKR